MLYHPSQLDQNEGDGVLADVLRRGAQPEQSGPPIGLMYKGTRSPDESSAEAARGICICGPVSRCHIISVRLLLVFECYSAYLVSVACRGRVQVLVDDAEFIYNQTALSRLIECEKSF